MPRKGKKRGLLRFLLPSRGPGAALRNTAKYTLLTINIILFYNLVVNPLNEWLSNQSLFVKLMAFVATLVGLLVIFKKEPPYLQG